MIKRTIEKTIASRLRTFPAVALLGPRQVGKTTLARTFSATYFDLELEEERLKLDIRWNELIRSKGLIVLDEAQNFPELFPRMRSAIDQERNRMGRFLILGSVSPGLMKEVSEFLTGRLAICELSPFSILEVRQGQEEALWLRGGYPDGGIRKTENFPVWQANYLDLLAMRDLPAWGLAARPKVTKRFFQMLAVAHGTIWNASQIGKSLGITYHTVNTYLDYLEQAYLIRKLQPYFINIKKRLVKSPKIYFRDSGLLHSLLKISRGEELLVQPWVGNSWEGWVVEQILIYLNAEGLQYDGPYYLRTNDGYEIDLIFTLAGTTFAVEVKLTTSPGKDDMEGLQKASALIGKPVKALISRTIHPAQSGESISTNLRGFLLYLQSRMGTKVVRREGGS
jgi:predicted AAA+ superfamily ATPase